MTTAAAAAMRTVSPDRQPGPRGTLWVLRTFLVAHAAAAIAQPILAGRYLSGDFDALGVHGGNAGIVLLLDMAAGVVAVIYWLVGRGRGWPSLVLAALFVLEVGQTAAGASRVLTVHIPLGVAIVMIAIAMAIWSFRSGARRTRAWRIPRRRAAVDL